MDRRHRKKFVDARNQTRLGPGQALRGEYIGRQFPLINHPFMIPRRMCRPTDPLPAGGHYLQFMLVVHQIANRQSLPSRTAAAAEERVRAAMRSVATSCRTCPFRGSPVLRRIFIHAYGLLCLSRRSCSTTTHAYRPRPLSAVPASGQSGLVSG